MNLHPAESADGDRNALTYEVIGLAMQVHRELGPGLGEVFYHRRLASLLLSAGISYLYKPRRELVYHGHVADVFEPDLVVPGQLVIELKAQKGGFTNQSLTQLLAYLKFCGLLRLPWGITVHFGKRSLALRFVSHPAGQPMQQGQKLPHRFRATADETRPDKPDRFRATADETRPDKPDRFRATADNRKFMEVPLRCEALTSDYSI